MWHWGCVGVAVRAREGVAVCGVAVCGFCGVRELQCVGVAACESCGV